MVFVTGGTGFIGRWVVKRLLKEKQEVLLLVRDKVNYVPISNEYVIEGSLENIESWKQKVKKNTIETCIHLAWEGIPDYSYEMSKKNLVYGLNILEICRDLVIPNLVISGSCWEYFNPKGSILVKHELDESNAFKASKNSLHQMAHAFCLENGIHLNWMRLFYVYGPGQRSESLIPYIIECYKKKQQPNLNGAYNKNDFVYVGDVADAIVKVALQHDFLEVLNVGSGHSTQVLEIVKCVAKQMGCEVDTSKYIKSPNCVDFYADYDEMYEMYRWFAKTSIEQGIKQMLGSSIGA